VSKLNCNFKWLSLYLDGELSLRKRDKLEKHLQVCEACAEKLEELKELESLAARTRLPQVSEAYWENFAVRVRNKLLLREKEPRSQILWQRLKAAFQISPFRLKLAAGIATIFIAAWVGKIYMDYRPAPIEKQLYSPGVVLPEKSGLPAESAETVLPPSKAEKDLVKGKSLVKSELKKAISSKPYSQAVPSENQAPPAKETSRYESAPVQLSPEVVTGEKPVIEKGETSNLRRISPKNIEVPPVKSVDELLAAQQGFTAKPIKPSPDTVGELHVRGGSAGEITKPIQTKEEQIEFAAEAASPVGKLPLGASKDSVSKVDSLRNAIQKQEKLILSQPADSTLEKAYRDLAQNYLNLCLLTKNKEDIKFGQKRIHEILKRYLYAETRLSLNNVLEQLRALEKSLK
jgi:hypothetical protein